MEKTLSDFEKHFAKGIYALVTSLLICILKKEEEEDADAEQILKDMKLFLYKMKERYQGEIPQALRDAQNQID
jgi:hypothetical protein